MVSAMVMMAKVTRTIFIGSPPVVPSEEIIARPPSDSNLSRMERPD
jgi:hypothetical protein